MKQLIVRLAISALAFTAGATCAVSYRAYSAFHNAALNAREGALRVNLFRLRGLLDQHAAESGQYPNSLGDLVQAGYLPDIPADPVTGRVDWVEEIGHDPNTPEGALAIVNVRSRSSARSTQGTIYSEW
jgi:general secretion pathway protein G